MRRRSDRGELGEPELARSSRQAVFDVHELVLARAPNEFFVGPRVRDEAAFIACLGPVADACAGEIHLALVPHPGEWESAAAVDARLWTRSSGVWRSLQRGGD